MKLAYGLGWMVLTSLAVAAGCDDNRKVVDLGAGGLGEDESGGSDGHSAAGPPKGGGGSDARGGQSTGGQGASGSPESSAGGDATAGQGTGGQGGAGPSECPSVYFTAQGQPCAPDGLFCADQVGDPCSFGNMLLCSNGVWQRQEALPSPCGGAGGGGPGAGGAAGAQ
jgi:hypothetical protein